MIFIIFTFVTIFIQMNEFQPQCFLHLQYEVDPKVFAPRVDFLHLIDVRHDMTR